MIRLPAAFVAALLVWAAAGAVTPGSARADATIEATAVENGYPREIVFTLTASAPVEITDVTLRYTIAGTGVGAIGKPEPDAFTPGTSVSTRVKVDTNPNTAWIPVGNTIEWHWELTLADGSVTIGPSSAYLYMPPDKDWKTAENAMATIYYTGPRENLADDLLTAIDETLERHGRQLLRTDLEEAITVVIMSTANELQEAQPSKGTTLDNSDAVVTCGFRPNNSKKLIFGTIQCGGSDPVDTIRHEFGHILNAAAGEGTLVELPTWLEEGLAVYAQESPEEYTATFESFARRDRLIPFREMSLPVADEARTILQYGQAYVMVDYLIETYGQTKLNELLGRTKANTRFDVAFEETYGFDIAGFEEEFLAALAGGTAPTPRATQDDRPAQPTVQPTPREQNQRGQPTAEPRSGGQVVDDDGGDDGFDRTMVGLVGVAVILMLAAVMSFLLLMFMQNQRAPRT